MEVSFATANGEASVSPATLTFTDTSSTTNSIDQFIDNVRVTNREGLTLVGPNPPGQPPLNMADRDWFQWQRDHPAGDRATQRRPFTSNR